MNAARWPEAPLREILARSEDWISIDPEKDYRQVTIRLWGKGAVLRGTVKGSAIAASEQLRVKKGQFIMSKIDARHGAFGLIPAELDGAVVSSDFPVFDVDTTRLIPRFLNWMSKTAWFVALCSSASEGSTNRVRLKEERFLNQRVPLPTLGEQQRLVVRLDAVATHVDAATGHIAAVAEESSALLRQFIRSSVDRGGSLVSLADIVTLRESDTTVFPEENYALAGVYSFGRGVFPARIIAGSETRYSELIKLRRDNFVYPKLMAWEGALGSVPPNCDGRFVSPEFCVFEVDTARVSPRILDVYFRDPATWPSLQSGSTGTNLRRRRLYPVDFLRLKIPVPTASNQRVFERMLSRADRCRSLQEESAAELSRLLPSMLDRAF
jgi:type I restriction enzyme S subunit